MYVHPWLPGQAHLPQDPPEHEEQGRHAIESTLRLCSCSHGSKADHVRPREHKANGAGPECPQPPPGLSERQSHVQASSEADCSVRSSQTLPGTKDAGEVLPALY